jgi:UDP-galactose transporter B1
VEDGSSDKFRSALVINTCQSALSSLSALLYILFRRKSGDTLVQILGLQTSPLTSSPSHGTIGSNGTANDDNEPPRSQSLLSLNRSLLLRYLQCSVFITAAAPFGFAALSYITYPAMVLGKSCKLVPVMIMNVLLYRRRFAPHKYLVVFFVTAGITMFMGFGNEHPTSGKATKGNEPGHRSAYADIIGITYLLINLALDGATNSTQDEVFTRYRVTGQQMMFWINIFCTTLSTLLSILPLPQIPVIHPSSSGQTELGVALQFIRSHPSIVVPLAEFAFTGALGQLFIFETLQHFGSLTLVYVFLFCERC